MMNGRSRRRSIPIQTDNDREMPPVPPEESGPGQAEETGNGFSEMDPEHDPFRQIAELEAALKDAEDRALRARADMQNYRRRVTDETAQRVRYAAEGLMHDLIPVLDHFEMAVAAADVTDETRMVCKGYEMILQQLRDVVARHGLTEIEAVEGMFFDAEFHEAVESVPTAEPCEGTVLRIIRRGYRYHDRMLRPVQVAVAVAPAARS